MFGKTITEGPKKTIPGSLTAVRDDRELLFENKPNFIHHKILNVVRYPYFETILSTPRMLRYKIACGHNSRKAMMLYRLNLRLSQELFTIISCFEIALRNTIDRQYIRLHGPDWLYDSIQPDGMFDNHACRNSGERVVQELNGLGSHYTHHKLLVKMAFGFWRQLFAQSQFRAGGQNLMQIFPGKPTSTPAMQYNQGFIFHELGRLKDLRNRIAHHEPICFRPSTAIACTAYVRDHHALLLRLFQWMRIDEWALLYGLDHIETLCTKIDQL